VSRLAGVLQGGSRAGGASSLDEESTKMVLKVGVVVDDGQKLQVCQDDEDDGSYHKNNIW
jgi:hypothetical protein